MHPITLWDTLPSSLHPCMHAISFLAFSLSYSSDYSDVCCLLTSCDRFFKKPPDCCCISLYVGPVWVLSSLSSRRICLGVGGGATSSVNSRFWKENADTDFWLGKKEAWKEKIRRSLYSQRHCVPCEVEGSWIDGTAFIEVYKRENSGSSKFHGVCFILSIHLECVWLATISVGDCPIFFYSVRVVSLDDLPQDTPLLVLLFVWCFHFPF